MSPSRRTKFASTNCVVAEILQFMLVPLLVTSSKTYVNKVLLLALPYTHPSGHTAPQVLQPAWSACRSNAIV